MSVDKECDVCRSAIDLKPVELGIYPFVLPRLCYTCRKLICDLLGDLQGIATNAANVTRTRILKEGTIQ